MENLNLPRQLTINGGTYALVESEPEPAQKVKGHRRTLGANIFRRLKEKNMPVSHFCEMADEISYVTLAKINAGQRVNRVSYEKYRAGVKRAGL